jgi:multiple sugar transport system substrate-binding protein
MHQSDRRRRFPRRLLGLGAAVVSLATVTAACGSAGGANSSGGGKNTIEVTYQFQQTPGAVDTSGEWFKKVIPQFEKQHPGVKVTLNAINASENDYYTKLDLLESSRSTTPDIVMEDTFLVSSDEEAGYLRPLTKLVDSWPDWQKFVPIMKTITSYNGQVWGVPFSTDDRYLWYNADIFTKAGIPVPWHPATWAQVLSTLQTIHRKDPGVIPMNIYAGVPQGEAATMQGFEMLLYGTGYTLYDYKTGKWVVQDPGLTDAFRFLYDVYHNNLGAPPSQELTGTWGQTVALDLLPKSKLAVDLDGMWLPQNWPGKQFPGWQNIMRWTPMPTMNGQAPGYATLSGGWALSIPKYSPHPGLAWDFIKLATDTANEAYYGKVSANLPTRTDSAKVPLYAHSEPNITFSNSLLTHTYYRPAFPVYPKVSYVIQQLSGNIITGTMTPAQAASSYTSQVRKIVGASHAESLSSPMTHAQEYPAS